MMSEQAERYKTSRSLVATLVIAFLALALAALLIASISVFFFFAQAIQESVDSQQQLTAKEAATTVASFVQEKFSELEATVKIGEVTLASQEEQRDALGNLLGLVPAFRQLILFDSQDQDLAKISRVSQTAAQELLDRVEPDLFAEVRQGNRYVSPVYIDELTSEPMIMLAVPATDTFGDYQGALLAEVNLKFMWDLVDRLQVGEAGVAYVVDKQGNLLAYDDISRVLRGENISQLDVVGEFMRQPVPVGEAATSTVQGIDGSTVVGTYVPLGVPEWAVVVELPVLEAFRPGIQSAVILAAVILLLAMLVGLVTVYVARRLAAPLLDLTTTAGQITAGEMDLRAPLEGPTEVINLARAFNTMTAQLQESIDNLEDQVTERTADLEQRSTYLEATAEVGRAAASILDTDQLLQQTVELIRQGFGLYYVGLFLIDETGQWAMLRAGTGEAGRAMLARGHRIRSGEGMIGWAVAHGESRVAAEVGADAMRLATSELPETRSEAALPLRSRGQVLGALTVQHTQPGAFDQETMAVLQTMADQVAVAISNARLFQQAQEALDSTRRAYGEIGREAWSRFLFMQPDRGYYCDERGVSPVGESITSPEQGADQEQSNRDRPELTLSVRIHDQTLGAIKARKPEGSGEWTADEVELLRGLNEQLAVALESARLYQDTQRRAARDRLLAETTARMRESLDVETVLKTAVDEIARATGLAALDLQFVGELDQSGRSNQNGPES